MLRFVVLLAILQSEHLLLTVFKLVLRLVRMVVTFMLQALPSNASSFNSISARWNSRISSNPHPLISTLERTEAINGNSFLIRISIRDVLDAPGSLMDKPISLVEDYHCASSEDLSRNKRATSGTPPSVDLVMVRAATTAAVAAAVVAVIFIFV